MTKAANDNKNFSQKNSQKIISRNQVDTQTNLFKEFERVDNESAQKQYMETQYAAFFGSDEYYNLAPDRKDAVRSAYQKKANEDFSEKFSKQPKSCRQRARERADALYRELKSNPSKNPSEINYFDILKKFIEEEEAKEAEKIIERDKHTQAYFGKLHSAKSNLPQDEPESHIDKDGFIKDNKPSDEYYKRFR